MSEKNKNYKEKRRNSIHQHFTTKNFFFLVKVKPARSFNYASFGKIVKILEVKTFADLQDRNTYKLSTFKKSKSVERKPSQSASPLRYQSQSSFSSLKVQNYEAGKEYNTVPYYACVTILHFNIFRLEKMVLFMYFQSLTSGLNLPSIRLLILQQLGCTWMKNIN